MLTIPSGPAPERDNNDGLSGAIGRPHGLAAGYGQALTSPEPTSRAVLDAFEALPRKETFAHMRADLRLGSTGTMRDLMDQDARIFEGQSLHEHTTRVMDQYLKYFSGVALPQELQPPVGSDNVTALGAVLAKFSMHDCGKAIPEDKKNQHESTVEVMDWLFENGHLPLSAQQFKIISAIIHGDHLGDLVRSCGTAKPDFKADKVYLHEQKMAGNEPTFEQVKAHILDKSAYAAVGRDHKELEATAQRIDEIARELGMSGSDVLALYIRFYQSDTTAYTIDSRYSDPASGRVKVGSPSLEALYQINPGYEANGGDLYVLDAERGRLVFTKGLEESFRLLEQRVKELDQGRASELAGG